MTRSSHWPPGNCPARRPAATTRQKHRSISFHPRALIRKPHGKPAAGKSPDRMTQRKRRRQTFFGSLFPRFVFVPAHGIAGLPAIKVFVSWEWRNRTAKNGQGANGSSNRESS